MCTVTVRSDPRGLLVTMNRDEARTRAPEQPPVVSYTPAGLAWLAPRDGEGGGTWMGVNGLGLVACLLNRYEAAALPAAGPLSRGDIVPQVLAAGSLAEARAWLDLHLDPAPYAPFTLVIADPNASHVFSWDGMTRAWTSLPTPWAMVTSSLFDADRVLAWRTSAFAQWQADGEPFMGALPSFHLLQPEGESFCAPLMSRAVSCTRSITQAEVSPGGACVLRYVPVDGEPGPVASYVLPPSMEEPLHDA
jgi:hypothetical protein